MARVLIVVSSYCPAMLADMQRARMLAWELPKLGWDVEILTPRASEVRQDAVESDNAAFFAPGCPIHEAGSLCRALFEALGSRSLTWRTLLPIHRQGCQLLRSGRFDLVFFSTATFVYFALGPIWSRRFKVPYVLDFHDPWVRDRGADARYARGWKRHCAGILAERLERRTLRHASGLVAVSPRYIDTMRRRYEHLGPAWLAPARHAVIPFGVLEDDLAEVRSALPPGVREPADAIVLAYVGVGGAIMARGFTLLCRAVAALRAAQHPLAERVRIQLHGTTYGWREGDPKELAAVAVKHGIGDLVMESPARVSYRRSLELLLSADGALVLGVDDPGYMPSKLFSYALSGQPLLATLRRESPAFAQMESAALMGRALWFDDRGEMRIEDAARNVGAFLEEAAARRRFDRRPVLESFLASAMARRHAELFESCRSQVRNDFQDQGVLQHHRLLPSRMA